MIVSTTVVVPPPTWCSTSEDDALWLSLECFHRRGDAALFVIPRFSRPALTAAEWVGAPNLFLVSGVVFVDVVEAGFSAVLFLLSRVRGPAVQGDEERRAEGLLLHEDCRDLSSEAENTIRTGEARLGLLSPLLFEKGAVGVAGGYGLLDGATRWSLLVYAAGLLLLLLSRIVTAVVRPDRSVL